jgi:hypothetical protein
VGVIRAVETPLVPRLFVVMPVIVTAGRMVGARLICVIHAEQAAGRR